MIILIGVSIVFGAVIGGYVMAGGRAGALMHISELTIIGGAALGALVIMSPKKVAGFADTVPLKDTPPEDPLDRRITLLLRATPGNPSS